jgi:Protein of unknown function (DUF3093)
MAVPAGPTATASYTERLRCPWWLWLPVAGLAALFALEVGLGAPGVRTWLPLLVALGLVGGGVWWLGRIVITVTEAEFLADDARLPREVIADVIPLDATQKRLLLGPAADPLAFVIQRPWIAGAVQIVLDDPADPTPYWVISSRRPDALAAALLARSRNAA